MRNEGLRTMHSPDADQYITTAKVRARYGDVSHMWVERRLKDDPTFPKPRYIARRRYWLLGELVAWERSRAVAS